MILDGRGAWTQVAKYSSLDRPRFTLPVLQTPLDAAISAAGTRRRGTASSTMNGRVLGSCGERVHMESRSSASSARPALHRIALEGWICRISFPILP